MVSASSPTLLKRWVALELKRLRDAAGFTRQEVAARLRCNLSHIGHIETMRNLPRAPELEILLGYYGVPDRLDFFVEVVEKARRGKDWWTAYSGHVPTWFNLFLAMESAATRVQGYAGLIVPGLLQTPEYAEAIVKAGPGKRSQTEVDEQVELRMARQDILNRREDPAELWMVLDEAVLRRQVGGAKVLRDQLHRIAEMTERPHITIQVLEAAAGAHPAQHGTFLLLSFPKELSGDPGVVYCETQVGSCYYQESHEIDEYQQVMNHLRIQAAAPEGSLDIIASLAEEVG